MNARRLPQTLSLPQPLLGVYERIASAYNILFEDTSTLYTLRSGAGDPTGVVTPNYIGEEYLNTTGNHWYKAHGLTNADWTALN